MRTALLLVILVLQIFTLLYLIRTARNLGSKATKHQRELMENINMLRASGRSNILNHLVVHKTEEPQRVGYLKMLAVCRMKP